MSRQPTLLMKRTAKILSEDTRKSVSAAMRKAGYTKRTAEKPQQLTKSKPWKELMDQYFPEDKVAEIQGKLLTDPHKEVLVNGEIVNLYDGDIQAKALDMIHKLRGTYKATEVKLTGLEQFKALPQDQLEKLANGTT